VDKHARPFDKGLEELQKKLVHMAAIAETMIDKAIGELVTRDEHVADKVPEYEDELNRSQIEVDELALVLLATQQPVARDLRFIVAATKINSDLERIGDEAVNIAGRALNINAYPKIEINFDLKTLTRNVMAMLKRSLDALVNMDAAMAHAVIDSDDEIDETVQALFKQVKNEIRRQPEKIDYIIEYMRINRHLERIADHATNIAEDIVYMIEGKIVRHNYEK